MPPTRRKTSSTAQQTLAFGPHANKVTKPSVATSAKNLKSSSSQLSKATSTTPEVEDVKPTKAEREEITEVSSADRGLAFRVQDSQPKDELEEKARKIQDKQIKAYWRTTEEERKAPRVHQSRIPLPEKILRHFDLSSQYGPCIGIARTKRWKRAQTLGLRPPIEVLSVLLKQEEMVEKGSERAYVDELMNARLVVE